MAQSALLNNGKCKSCSNNPSIDYCANTPLVFTINALLLTKERDDMGRDFKVVFRGWIKQQNVIFYSNKLTQCRS